MLTSAKKRRGLAKRTQQMMVNILLERQRQERSLHEEMGPDRGSEAGDAVNVDDCMEFVEGGCFLIPRKVCVQSMAWTSVTNTNHVQNLMMM